ncbi:Mth938-like domain-containing protein [Xanthobacter autotrophicus DSM 431]|uniref:Mth938-like domain-containing protein n=1 Tax=Xanthobacter nonsaccharivorans TaxID=3119912 RepID=UPI003726EF13
MPRRVAIDGYGDTFFHFAGMSHAGSILALPSGIRPWSPTRMAEVDAEALAPILAEAQAFELLFLGTGKDPAHLKEPLKQLLRAAGLRFELMPTPQAAATYNVLLAEGRLIGAALIAV